MSWFTDNKKAEVQRTLTRILNRTASVASHVDEADDQRLDSRIPRVTPVVILPLDPEADQVQVTTGLTQDISCEGLSVATLGKLTNGGEFAVAIGNGEDSAVLNCRCVRSVSIGYGYFSHGMQATHVLSSHDFASLKELAEYLESNPPETSLSFIAS